MEQDNSIVEFRKYHFWRGFRAGLLVAVIPIALLMWAVQILLDATIH